MASYVHASHSRSIPTRSVWRATWRRVALAMTVATERKRLTHLTDEQLRDIGLTRTDADREAARSLWDLPSRRS